MGILGHGATISAMTNGCGCGGLDIQDHKLQMLAVVPLQDVKVMVISPTEFSVACENKLPNTHYFKLQTPTETQEFIKILSLAIQQPIHYPFQVSSSGSHTTAIDYFKSSLKITNKKKLAEIKKIVNQTGNDKPFEGYYKPIRWDINELRAEAAELFSEFIQFQEIYNTERDSLPKLDSSSSYTPIQHGWRILSGSLSDIILWCLLTSDRSQKSTLPSLPPSLLFPSLPLSSFYLIPYLLPPSLSLLHFPSLPHCPITSSSLQLLFTLFH